MMFSFISRNIDDEPTRRDVRRTQCGITRTPKFSEKIIERKRYCYCIQNTTFSFMLRITRKSGARLDGKIFESEKNVTKQTTKRRD